jgi:hypothetical protein
MADSLTSRGMQCAGVFAVQNESFRCILPASIWGDLSD